MSLQADLNHFLDLEEANDIAMGKFRSMAQDAVADDPFVHWGIDRLEEELINSSPPGMLLAAIVKAFGIDCEVYNPWAGNEARGIFNDFMESQIESLAQHYKDHA